MTTTVKWTIQKGLPLTEPIIVDKSEIPPNCFGAFVSVERSPCQRLPQWPEDIHGCIGDWDHQYQPQSASHIMDIIGRVSYSATHSDSRRHHFPHSLWVDIHARYKVYYMLTPLHHVHPDTGIMATNVPFNNKTHGLIVISNNQQATYLPEVFPDVPWHEIKESLLGKAGASPLAAVNAQFMAYECKILYMTLLTFFLEPIHTFIREHYGDWIPYSGTAHGDITRDFTQQVRNLATMCDILMLEPYGFPLDPSLKATIAQNLTKGSDPTTTDRQALGFLMLGRHLINATGIIPLRDQLCHELTKPSAPIDLQFELYELLMCLAIVTRRHPSVQCQSIIEHHYHKMQLPPTIDRDAIFQVNWMAKFMKEWCITHGNRPHPGFSTWLLQYHNQWINPLSETNYLAVTWEAITAIWYLTQNPQLESPIGDLIQRLSHRRNTFGLYAFQDTTYRLDITGHVMNGFYNLAQAQTQSCTQLHLQTGGAITLKPHQVIPINYIRHHYGLLLYHSVGSGKTITALSAMHHHKKPIIVVGPKSSEKAFIDDSRRLGGIPFTFYTYQKTKMLLETNFDLFNDTCAIIDEAHHLRNDTKDNMVISGALSQAYRVILLTATPIINYLDDISPLINIVKRSNVLPTDREQFNFLYFNEHELTIKNENIIASKLRNAISFYEKADDANYPSSDVVYKKVIMTKPQMDEYSKYVIKLLFAGDMPQRTDVFDIDFDMLTWRKRNSFLTATRQLSNIVEGQTCSTKLQGIYDTISSGPFPAVIYSNFLTHGIYAITPLLTAGNITYATITGNINRDKIQKIINEYNSGKYQVLLLSTAGSESLDLKNTRQIHVMEPHWNEPKIQQVIGRAIRYMSHSTLHLKERHVMVYHWASVFPEQFGNLSADEYLIKVGQRKAKIFQKFKKLIVENSIEHYQTGGTLHQHYLKYRHQYLTLKNRP